MKTGTSGLLRVVDSTLDTVRDTEHPDRTWVSLGSVSRMVASDLNEVICDPGGP